jgi:hypothetical protein
VALLFRRYRGKNVGLAFRRFAHVCEILSGDREQTVKISLVLRQRRRAGSFN